MDKNALLTLLLKAQQGELTPEETAALDAWYASFDEAGHTIIFKDADHEALIRERLQRRIRQHIPDHLPDLPAPARVKKKARLAVIFSTAAAAALLLFILAFYLTYNKKQLTPENAALLSCHTPAGKLLKVTLPDGSEIWLNANSTLQYPDRFNGKTREVYLTGEAFFNVAQLPGQPFTVHSGQLHTVVLGTSFNVNAYPELSRIRIHVATGKVGVMAGASTLGTLTPDQLLTYDKTHASFTTTSGKTLPGKDWRQGVIHLDGASFAELALVLKNNFGFTLKSSRTDMARIRFSIDLRTAQPVDDIMRAICKISGARYRISGQVITMY